VTLDLESAGQNGEAHDGSPRRRLVVHRSAEQRLSEPRATPMSTPDTSIRLGVRRTRRRPLLAPIVLACLALGLAGFAVLLTGFGDADPTAARSGSSTAAGDGAGQPVTPLFASHAGLLIHLPVHPDGITAVGFHQASGDKAVSMRSLVPDAGDAVASDDAARLFASAPEDDPTFELWRGTVHRMWRSNRSGPPDTAVDVGGAPGTAVVSPVSGVVTQVRPYELYDKYEDVAIHIAPDGVPGVELVIIHVASPEVTAGSRVVGGVTRLAQIRLLSDRVSHQLGQYAADGGDHIHLQINRVENGGPATGADGS